MEAQSQCERVTKSRLLVRLKPVDRISNKRSGIPNRQCSSVGTPSTFNKYEPIMLASWTHFPDAVAVEGVVVVRIHWPISTSVHLPLARVLEHSADAEG